MTAVESGCNPMRTTISSVLSSCGYESWPSVLRRRPFTKVPFALWVSRMNIWMEQFFGASVAEDTYTSQRRTLFPSCHTSACRLLTTLESKLTCFLSCTCGGHLLVLRPNCTRRPGVVRVICLGIKNESFRGYRYSAGYAGDIESIGAGIVGAQIECTRGVG